MMSPEEHKLIIAMFASQAEITRAILTALTSHGHLKHDDLPAYVALVTSPPEPRQKVFDAVAKPYQDIAQGLGMQIVFSEN